MLFEFVIMLVRYIEEGHHIPIRYLILISMTAILRQLLVLHDRGTETLLLPTLLTLFFLVSSILIYTHKKEPQRKSLRFLFCVRR